MGAAPAFAAGELPDPSEIDYTEIQGDSPQDTGTHNEIPVYGYIGEDAELEDPDKEDPDVPPTPHPYAINVSVPTKVIWAAFEADAGDITAPAYKIYNNGKAATQSVDVELTSFTAKPGNPDNTDVDKFLSLDIESADLHDSGKIAVVTSDGTTASYPASTVALGTTGEDELAEDDAWDFTLGGGYDHDHVSNTIGFTTPKAPSYDMVLTFLID
jgi:hypothetical protein